MSKKETEILLSQIKYLTDLINSANQKPSTSNTVQQTNTEHGNNFRHPNKRSFSVLKEDKRRKAEQKANSFVWKKQNVPNPGSSHPSSSSKSSHEILETPRNCSDCSSQYKFTSVVENIKDNGKRKPETVSSNTSKPITTSENGQISTGDNSRSQVHNNRRGHSQTVVNSNYGKSEKTGVKFNCETSKAMVRENSSETSKPVVRNNSSEMSKPLVKNNSSETSKPVVRNNSSEISKPLVKNNSSETSKPVVRNNSSEISKPVVKNNSSETSRPIVKNSSKDSSKTVVKKNSSETSRPVVRNSSETSVPVLNKSKGKLSNPFSSNSCISANSNSNQKLNLTGNKNSRDQSNLNIDTNKGVVSKSLNSNDSSEMLKFVIKDNSSEPKSFISINSREQSQFKSTDSSIEPSTVVMSEISKRNKKLPPKLTSSSSSPSKLSSSVEEWSKKLEETKAKVVQLQKSLSTRETLLATKSQPSCSQQNNIHSTNVKLHSTSTQKIKSHLDSKSAESESGYKSFKYSVTPISDLISKNLRKGAVENDNNGISRLTTHASITPISDLISKNLSRKKSKSNGFRKTKEWSKNLKASSTDPTRYTSYRNLKTKFKSVQYPSPLDGKVTMRNRSYSNVPLNSNSAASSAASRYSWKNSQSQLVASGIVNKYKVRKSIGPGGTPKLKVNTGLRDKYRYIKQGHTGNTITTYNKYKLQQNSGKRIVSSYGRSKGNFLKRRHDDSNHRNHFTWNNKDQRPKNLPLIRNHTCNRFTVHKTKSRYTFDRRNAIKKSKPSILDGECLVMIGGVVYRTSNTSLIKASKHLMMNKTKRQSDIKGGQSKRTRTIIFRGVKFQMDNSGKTLKRLNSEDNSPRYNTGMEDTNGLMNNRVKRVDIGGVTYIQTKPGTLERLTSVTSRTLASRALYKSIMTAAAKHRKDNKGRQFCMFYNRFGKCRRSENCPYIHDPSKIAVCTRFLRGTCNVTDCPFSHNVDIHKMPVCLYFLRGICSRDNCPYLHVNVNKNAEICPDFLKGFCPLGEKCKKKHTLICQIYASTGHCPDGKTCKLRHKQLTRKRKRPANVLNSTQKGNQSVDTSTTVKDKLTREEETDIPFKMRKLPTFISLDVGTDYEENKERSKSSQDLNSTSATVEGVTDTKPIKIKPQL